MLINCIYKEIFYYFLSNYEFLIKSQEDKNCLKTTSDVETHSLYDISNKLNVCDIEKCFKSIGFFLDMLERNRKMFYKIDIQDICVCFYEKKYYFLITNFEHVLNINKNDELFITYPFTKTLFISDKLKYVDELPISISYKSIYYNLGIIIYWLLFGLDNFDVSRMEEYKDTPLYFCFMRCINENLEQRNFIWV